MDILVATVERGKIKTMGMQREREAVMSVEK